MESASKTQENPQTESSHFTPQQQKDTQLIAVLQEIYSLWSINDGPTLKAFDHCLERFEKETANTLKTLKSYQTKSVVKCFLDRFVEASDRRIKMGYAFLIQGLLINDEEISSWCKMFANKILEKSDRTFLKELGSDEKENTISRNFKLVVKNVKAQILEAMKVISQVKEAEEDLKEEGEGKKKESEEKKENEENGKVEREDDLEEEKV